VLPCLHPFPYEISTEAAETAAAERDNDTNDGDKRSCVLEEAIGAYLINR